MTAVYDQMTISGLVRLQYRSQYRKNDTGLVKIKYNIVIMYKYRYFSVHARNTVARDEFTKT